jgi:hypothetical protein
MHYTDLKIKQLKETGTRKNFMVLKTFKSTWIQDHGKGNTDPVHTMKVYTGSRCTAPLFLTSVLQGGELSKSCPTHSGHFGEEKDLLTLL